MKQDFFKKPCGVQFSVGSFEKKARAKEVSGPFLRDAR